MTIFVPAGTALDNLASMPPVVSPLIPALATDMGCPFARRICSSWAGYADDAPTPYPAVLLAPTATIWALPVEMAAKASRKIIIKHLNIRRSPKLNQGDHNMRAERVVKIGSTSRASNATPLQMIKLTQERDIMVICNVA